MFMNLSVCLGVRGMEIHITILVKFGKSGIDYSLVY